MTFSFHAYSSMCLCAADHSWRVLNKTRCDIGNGEASLLTLEACKAACGSTCPFLLYHPNSPLQQNCWIAHADHSIASNCVSADGEWTVFIRPGLIWFDWDLWDEAMKFGSQVFLCTFRVMVWPERFCERVRSVELTCIFFCRIF